MGGRSVSTTAGIATDEGCLEKRSRKQKGGETGITRVLKKENGFKAEDVTQEAREKEEMGDYRAFH